MLALATVVALATTASAEEPPRARSLAGSMQIDYLTVASDPAARDEVFDGATVELSLKLAADVGESITANVKVCVACHGLEVGMAFFDLSLADGLNLRVGRFTPAFGGFPLRHDPANHRTSDKPLPYDMGRMLHFSEWNEGILPAPWVDNGVELNGTRWLGDATSVDLAVYAVSGPKGDSGGFDFDYKQSRTPERYYVDNNSRPAVGGRVAVTTEIGSTMSTFGVSGMAGHYDPEADLGFLIAGAEASFRVEDVTVRAEYLLRRTQFAIGDDPETRLKYGPGADGVYDDFVVRDGFYVEAEVPIQRVELIGRVDGLRRSGNLLAGSPLGSESSIMRYTGAIAAKVSAELRVKASLELYDFSDFENELAVHLGVAAPF